MCGLPPEIDSAEVRESLRKFGVRNAEELWFSAPVGEKPVLICTECGKDFGPHIGLMCQTAEEDV